MNNKIYIIGCNHYDPFGREKIVKQLTVLRDIHGFIPDCIAVEWKKSIAKKIIKKRCKYKKLIKIKYPFLSADDIYKLSRSLAYEADSHQIIYPTLPIIWLDEYITITKKIKRIVSNYPYGTLNEHYNNFHNTGIIPKDLASFSVAAIKVNGMMPDLKRDNNFFKITTKAIDSGYKKIAAIVGSKHSDLNIKGNYANLLIDSGYDVDTIRTDVL